MYQLNGEEHVLGWMRTHSSEECEAMLTFLPRLAADPLGVSTAIRRQPGVPACTVDVPNTNAFLDYMVVDQYMTVLILSASDIDL